MKTSSNGVESSLESCRNVQVPNRFGSEQGSDRTSELAKGIRTGLGTCHWKELGRKEGHCLELEWTEDRIGAMEQTGSEEGNRTDRSRQASQTEGIRSDEIPPNRTQAETPEPNRYLKGENH